MNPHNNVGTSDSDDVLDTHVAANPADEVIAQNEQRQRFGEPIPPDKTR